MDVVLRCHDPSRRMELSRAVFSLVGQDHRPLRILLVTQRFGAEAVRATRALLAPMLAWAGDVALEVLDYRDDHPADARSALMNMGMDQAQGRYLGFLDYDDVLFPEAYRLLAAQLRAGGAGIAFARTPVMLADVHQGFVHAQSRSHPFPGQHLRDLFRANFAPIHSYLMDRARIPPRLLRFEPSLTVEEDYDFLLRLCAEVPADFTLAATEVGLYFYKTDASNTFVRGADVPPALMARIEAARDFVELRRRMTPVSPAIQASLGLAEPTPGLSIRGVLDALDAAG